MPGLLVPAPLMPTFTEQWFCEESQVVLSDLVRTTAGLEGDVLEIGSWEGRSTVALARAVAPDTVHAVDTWAGSPGEISEQLASERDVYATFLENMAELTDGNVEVHRMDWRVYMDQHREPIRFAFIDALHTYEEVKEQIRAIRPWLVPGGLICGDDVHHPPIRDAVIETLGYFNRAATLWIRPWGSRARN